MESFSKKIEVRWADLDPNFHVLHSKYYDFGAYCRMAFLTEHGITPLLMQEHATGPIIFREECLFKREIKFGDEIMITLMLANLSEDNRKWTMVHEIWKNGNEQAAFITVDGAWMNTKLRKVTVPPEIFMKGFNAIPKTENFNQ